jgi:Cd2+/Zn2+-exporting ATPase
LDDAGFAPVLVSVDGRTRGVIALADPVRPTSAATVAALHRLGIATAMLTGDRARVAERLGREVGVGMIRSELLPDQKLAAIEALKVQGAVAMVGDGINDAPALAAASVGVAMGLAGSDVALETADVVLAGDDLAQLPGAVGLARSTIRVVRQNIAVSLLVKALFLGLTVVGVTNLWLAVLADMGTSLLVTANSMRLAGLRSDRNRYASER